MSSKNELACIYASLILIDDDVAVTGEKVQTLLKAANLEVEPYWPGLFAKALESISNPKDLLTKIGSGVGAAGPAGGAGAAAAAAPAAETKAEEKKKEEEEEVSDDDMGFGLFD